MKADTVMTAIYYHHYYGRDEIPLQFVFTTTVESAAVVAIALVVIEVGGKGMLLESLMTTCYSVKVWD